MINFTVKSCICINIMLTKLKVKIKKYVFLFSYAFFLMFHAVLILIKESVAKEPVY